MPPADVDDVEAEALLLRVPEPVVAVFVEFEAELAPPVPPLPLVAAPRLDELPPELSSEPPVKASPPHARPLKSTKLLAVMNRGRWETPCEAQRQ